jgi:predicted histidine transporter YuiF (NhaC family)
LLRVLLHPEASFKVSKVHAADIIALVEAIAGMIFFTTPCKQRKNYLYHKKKKKKNKKNKTKKEGKKRKKKKRDSATNR